MNGSTPESAKAFLGWLSQYSPEVYAVVLQQVPEAAAAVSVPSHMEGLGQDPTVPQQAPQEPAWWEKVLSAATDIGSAYLNYEAQKDILKVQQERASRGLPPIPSDVYAPTIRHRVDIPPEFQTAAIGTGTLVLLGAGALLLMFMMNR